MASEERGIPVRLCAASQRSGWECCSFRCTTSSCRYVEPRGYFDETVPADKQHWLTGEHHKPIDGYNLPIGSTLDEKALVLSAYVPQHRGEFDGGVDVPLVYIMTYEVDSIQSSEDYAFIRGQLLTFAEMEQYKVYEDENIFASM